MTGAAGVHMTVVKELDVLSKSIAPLRPIAYTTSIILDSKPTVHHLRVLDHVIGLSGSFGPSKSTMYGAPSSASPTLHPVGGTMLLIKTAPEPRSVINLF